MSDKKRRDITLGEMQDECKRVDRKCEKCDRKISVACGSMVNSNGYFETPKDWDLNDPPRFNEAQMAFWRGLYEIGVDRATCVQNGVTANLFIGTACVAILSELAMMCGIKAGETLDLAELLGKDGAE